MAVPGRAAGKQSERSADAGSQHAAGARGVRIYAVGVGDVQRADASDQPTGGLSDRHAHSEWDQDAARIAQRDGRMNFRAVEAGERAPEPGGHD